MIFGMGELGPINVIEMKYLIFILISSAMFSALVFGDLADLVKAIFKKENDR
jgi:hypothetical protein